MWWLLACSADDPVADGPGEAARRHLAELGEDTTVPDDADTTEPPPADDTTPPPPPEDTGEPPPPAGEWVCESGARNGSEVCDDDPFDVPDPSVRYGLQCTEATGGVAYIATNTGPVMSDGVPRCQGWEEQGMNAWDHLDYVERVTCTEPGWTMELDLSAYRGQTLWVGAHPQPDGSGMMTLACFVIWEEG
ncbi:MAG: hypothetical protein ACOZNI_18510 [Myxococcota bacterium]